MPTEASWLLAQLTHDLTKVRHIGYTTVRHPALCGPRVRIEVHDRHPSIEVGRHSGVGADLMDVRDGRRHSVASRPAEVHDAHGQRDRDRADGNRDRERTPTPTCLEVSRSCCGWQLVVAIKVAANGEGTEGSPDDDGCDSCVRSRHPRPEDGDLRLTRPAECGQGGPCPNDESTEGDGRPEG
jgi:hypothetical protein